MGVCACLKASTAGWAGGWVGGMVGWLSMLIGRLVGWARAMPGRHKLAETATVRGGSACHLSYCKEVTRMLASWPHRLHCIAGHIWLHAPHAPLIKSQDYDKALHLAEAAGQQPDPYALLSSRMLRLCDLMSLQDYDEALRLAEAAGQQPDPYVLNSRGNCRASLGEGWLQLQLWHPVLCCDNSKNIVQAAALRQPACSKLVPHPGMAAWRGSLGCCGIAEKHWREEW